MVNLQQNKTASRSEDILDQKVDLKVLRETMDNLKNTQQSATYELSKNVSELYTLMTKGRSGHQGQLGEVTLRMILESSGLKSGINFDEQKQIGSEKPDIVVHLPDNRKVVIDSKVSLNDYSMFLNADNDQSKDLAKKNHINSVKKHIKTLSSTEYRALYGNSSLDLVIMFMNVEGAYILACEDDLIKEALRNKIAIVGPTNAGKSSLLNYLSQRDVAIVSEIAGTTRDVIEAHLNLDGFPVVVSDTAGIRESKDEIERKGIKLALDRAENADLNLIVIEPKSLDFAQFLSNFGPKKSILVINKIDLGFRRTSNEIEKYESVQVSIKQEKNLEKLIDMIKKNLKNCGVLIEHIEETWGKKTFFLDSVILNSEKNSIDKRHKLLNTLHFLQKNSDKIIYTELLIWLFLQSENYNAALIQSIALDKRFKLNGEQVMRIGELSLNNQNYKAAKNAEMV